MPERLMPAKYLVLCIARYIYQWIGFARRTKNKIRVHMVLLPVAQKDAAMHQEPDEAARTERSAVPMVVRRLEQQIEVSFDILRAVQLASARSCQGVAAYLPLCPTGGATADGAEAGETGEAGRRGTWYCNRTAPAVCCSNWRWPAPVPHQGGGPSCRAMPGRPALRRSVPYLPAVSWGRCAFVVCFHGKLIYNCNVRCTHLNMLIPRCTLSCLMCAVAFFTTQQTPKTWPANKLRPFLLHMRYFRQIHGGIQHGRVSRMHPGLRPEVDGLADAVQSLIRHVDSL